MAYCRTDPDSQEESFQYRHPLQSSYKSSSCSNNRSHNEFKTRRRKHNAMKKCKDNSYCSNNEETRDLPLDTSEWKFEDLDSIGIYYKMKPESLTSLLDTVYEKTSMFGQLTPDQLNFVKCLQDCFTFTVTISDITVGCDLNVDILPLEDKVKNGLDRDVTEQNPSLKWAAEEFIRSIIMMMKYTQEKSKDGNCVSKAVFVDLFKLFARMCGLTASPGKEWEQTKNILHHKVHSASDIVILGGDFLQTLSPTAVSVISVVEMKAMTWYVNESHAPDSVKKRPTTWSSEYGSVRSKESASKMTFSNPHESSEDNEVLVNEEPFIFKKITSKILARHCGELVTHIHAYSTKFSNQELKKRFHPGMIVIGTQIIFTLLELNFDHMQEILHNSVVEKGSSFISYTEPMDFLRKEDRDLLIESLIRFTNTQK